MEARLVAYVGLGSAIGGMARYAASTWVSRPDFPFGTLTVNLVGCLLIGLVVFAGTAGGWLSERVWTFAVVGILGGFTTMSAFAFDTLALASAGAVPKAALNMGLTLGGCLLAVWLGKTLATATI